MLEMLRVLHVYSYIHTFICTYCIEISFYRYTNIIISYIIVTQNLIEYKANNLQILIIS